MLTCAAFHFKGPSSKERVLEALNTSPYRARKNRNPERTPGTCEWFENHADFKQWKESSSSSMLWVSANPGCGKSVLARYLVDSVLSTHGSRTVCYFFFKDDFADQKTATGAICCILHQLFTDRPGLFSEDIAKRLDAHRAHLASSLDEVWDALVAASQQKNAGEIVCILDAFDECSDDERRRLSANLRSFYNPDSEAKKKASLKFLVTSRPYDKIRRGFEPLNIPGLPVIHLKGESDTELTKIAREINIYIESKVSDMDHLLSRERKLLRQRLQGISNRTYLWVYLAIEWIKEETSNKISPESITSTLPTTVDQAYEKILAKSTNPKEARKLLHIVVATTRPLTVAEMDLAMNLGPGANPADYSADWDPYQEDRCGKYIRNLCGLFVNIVDSKVYLLHQTAKEFLVPKPVPADEGNSGVGSAKPVWKSSFNSAESHSIVCNICLWHLCSKHSNIGRGRGHDFFQYCAINWPIHFRTAHTEHSATVIKSARTVCNTRTQLFKTWFNIYWAAMQVGRVPNLTIIMAASFFGLDQILQLELASGNANVNIRDDIYQRSPLSWAAENGFDNAVELLLKGPKFDLGRALFKPLTLRGAKVDAKDRHNRTPLSYAAWNGHLEVVKRLRQANASINTKDDINATPLYYALCTGNMDVVGEMSKGVQTDEAQGMRNKLLLSAAAVGQERVVKMLLETGADLETRDANIKNTPLLVAVKRMHVGVARLLLDKDANIEAMDVTGLLPLQSAIGRFFLPMVELLLEKDADTEVMAARRECLGRDAREKMTRSRETPLLLLCGYGIHRSTRIVRLLLDHGANTSARDYEKGATPLHWAVRAGLEEETQLLLSHDADIESRDAWGNTPLHWANMTMAQQLLAKGAHINAVNYAGETTLYRRAQLDQLHAVAFLLEHGAKADIKTYETWTALMIAVGSGLEDMVELLLIHGANIHIKDGGGRTALRIAIRNGDKEIIQSLLSYGATDSDIDDSGQTALLLARKAARAEIMRMQLEYGGYRSQEKLAVGPEPDYICPLPPS